MKQVEMRDGHNSFNLKVGEAYNVTFNADTKKAIATKDERIAELREMANRSFDALMILNSQCLVLHAIVERLTGEVVEDPAEFLRALQGASNE